MIVNAFTVKQVDIVQEPVFSIEEQLCYNILGTPAWGDSSGKIVFSGYSDFGNFSSSEIVDNLIENQIYFLYNPNCGWCKKQIEYFGNTWNKYLESGLVVDCTQFK